MTYLKLMFVNSTAPQLIETRFFHPLAGREIRAVRGKTGGAFQNVGSFQWSVGVKAIITLLATCAAEARKSNSNRVVQLLGEGASHAASLDYSLSKNTAWLCEMFGSDSAGFPLARRLIVRSNSERRRPGPVIISLNHHFLPPRAISVFIDEIEINDEQEIGNIAASFSAHKDIRFDAITLTSESANCSFERAATVEGSIRNNLVNSTSASAFLSDSKSENGVALTRSLATPQVLPPAYQKILDSFVAEQDSLTCVPSVFIHSPTRERLRELFQREILSSLVTTNIFSSTYLRQKVNDVFLDRSFCALAGKNRTITSDIDLQLASSGRLGSASDRVERDRVLKDRSICIAFPPPHISALAILLVLKYVKGFNLEFDFGFAHSGEIVERICSKSFRKYPDFCMLSIASAGSLLGAKNGTSYRPVMLMPDISHRVVKSGSEGSQATKNPATSYAYLLGMPSTTAFLFNKLVTSGLVNPKKVESVHLEPFETPDALAQAGESFRAIMWFPCTEFNRLFNNCSFDTQTAKINPNKEIILFGSEVMWADPNIIRSFDIAIRDAWLDLSEGGTLFDLIIEMIFAYRPYLNLLGRYCGLNTISRLRRLNETGNTERAYSTKDMFPAVSKIAGNF